MEFILVQGAAPNLATAFFDGRYRFDWPAATFDYAVRAGDQTIAVASRAALARYRQHHAAIAQAYAAVLRIQ